MKILREKNIIEKKEWIDIWNNWDGKEVFAHPNYLKLFTDENCEATCIYHKTEESIILYPFILRKIDFNNSTVKLPNKIYDIASPYGYSGIYNIGKSLNEFEYKIFFKNFSDWAKDNNIVSEFIRFSLNSAAIEFYTGDAVYNNDNIVIDLTIGKDERWHRYKQKVRKNVNKALTNNIKVIVDESGLYLNDFYKIYNNTMERRNASNIYFFPINFFNSINKNLSGNFVYFHSIFDNQIISTELVLVSDYNIYSFLGGTLSNFYDYRPNDLLKHEIINWGIEKRKKQFILGGGYTPNDGIFNYKQSFEPENCTPFYIGKKIYNKELYDNLVNTRIMLNSEFDISSSYFPLYRAITES